MKQQKADKLSHCDFMIEVRIYFVEDTKGNIYRLVKSSSQGGTKNLLGIIHWVAGERGVLLAHGAHCLTNNSTRVTRTVLLFPDCIYTCKFILSYMKCVSDSLLKSCLILLVKLYELISLVFLSNVL